MKDGFELLGTPVGSDTFVKDACRGKVEKLNPLLSKLSLLQDAQIGVLLLRYCGVPKIMNLLRTVPPCLVDVACVQHDDNIVTTFEEIIGIKCTDTQKQQVRLSIKNGGFGLTSARDTAPSAFLGAWANSLNHLPVHDDYVRPMCSYVIDDLQSSNYSISTHLNSSLHDLHNDSQSLKEIIPSISSLPDHPKKLQRRLQLVKNKSSFQRYLEVCSTDKEKARLISSSGPNAGSWLEAIPSTQHFTLSSAQFRTAALMRLGAPLPALSNIQKCTQNCGNSVDLYGYHLLTCKWGGGPIHRHDHLSDSLYDMFRSLGFRCKKELQNQFLGKKRPDVAVYDYNQGKKLLLDMTVTHPWALHNIGSSKTISGYAASSKERSKNSKYLSAAIDLGHLFRPFALEVYGCWGAESVNTLKEAASLAPAALAMSYGDFANYWRRRLAVCLQKGNADMIHNKIAAIIGQTPIDPNSINNIEGRHYSIDFT